MEGAGIAPNIGQNPFPEGPLPTWWVPEFKWTLDLANHRARTDEHRIAMFPFALATDLPQTQVLGGDIAFNIDAGGQARRAPSRRGRRAAHRNARYARSRCCALPSILRQGRRRAQEGQP